MERGQRGFGGLTPQKKALLKKIIMEKVREEMRKEALAKKELKDKIINEKVKQLPSFSGMSKDNLERLCKDLHKKLSLAESEKFDIEKKLHQQEADINELHIKIQLKGKFVKPVLRKVNKSDTSKTRAIRGNKLGLFEDFSKVLTNHVESSVEV